MSARRVLDSYALIAFLENEAGAEQVSHFIKQARDAEKPLLMCVVNWGEVFYILCRAAGREAAEKAMQNIDTLPIDVTPVDKELTMLAADLKSTRKMSYADCFAAALAKMRKAELVTGDKEFKDVEKDIKVVWI